MQNYPIWNWVCFFKKGRFVESSLRLSKSPWLTNFYSLILFRFAYPLYATRCTLLVILPKNRHNTIKNREKCPWLGRLMIRSLCSSILHNYRGEGLIGFITSNMMDMLIAGTAAAFTGVVSGIKLGRKKGKRPEVLPTRHKPMRV